MRVLILGLLCALYVTGQNPDPVMSVGGGGGSGSGSGATQISELSDGTRVGDLEVNKVTGPASATDRAVAIYDGTTGKLVKVATGCTLDSGLTVMTCTGGYRAGDGTSESFVDLPETTAGGGTFSFSIAGVANQSEDACIALTGQPTAGQALRGTSTTSTINGRTCRQMEWYTAIVDTGSNGMVARTASGTGTARTITGTSNEITVTNGDGASGNPTLSIPSGIDLGSKTTLTHQRGTSLPGTCTVGESYQKTDATAASQWYLCTATNTWTAQGGSGAGYDPLDEDVFRIEEEFCTGDNTSASARAGTHGWRPTNISSGSWSFLNVGSATITDHPCIFRQTTAASSGSGGTLMLGNNATLANINGSDLNANVWEIRAYVKFNSIADVRLRFGFAQTESALVTSAAGWYIRYDTNSSFDDDAKGSGAGRWVAQMCTTCTGDTSGTTAAFGTAPAADTWYRLRMRRVASGVGGSPTVYFQVNSGTEVTACASGCDMTVTAIANIGVSPYFSFGTDTTGAKILDVDRFAMTMTLGAARY